MVCVLCCSMKSTDFGKAEPVSKAEEYSCNAG